MTVASRTKPYGFYKLRAGLYESLGGGYHRAEHLGPKDGQVTGWYISHLLPVTLTTDTGASYTALRYVRNNDVRYPTLAAVVDATYPMTRSTR